MGAPMFNSVPYQRHVATEAIASSNEATDSQKQTDGPEKVKVAKADEGGVRSPALDLVLNKVSRIVALTAWMGIFHINTFVIVLGLVYFPRPWALAALSLMAFVTVVPVNPESAWGKQFAAWVVAKVQPHFPVKVVLEDETAVDPTRAYVVGFEPHSVWPLGVIAFARGSSLSPFNRVRTLGSSALDHVPFCRHLWVWMGMGAVSRASFLALLGAGTSCVVIPGGVQECIHMNTKQEVLFLKKRLGFIRMAVISGAPLIPAFCFGQRNTFHYWFPKGKWFHTLSRQLKFAPLLYWGLWGGFIPLPSPMTVVMAKPIEVVKNENPTIEELKVLQGKFIGAMEALYEKYKVEYGAKGVELVLV